MSDMMDAKALSEQLLAFVGTMKQSVGRALEYDRLSKQANTEADVPRPLRESKGRHGTRVHTTGPLPCAKYLNWTKIDFFCMGIGFALYPCLRIVDVALGLQVYPCLPFASEHRLRHLDVCTVSTHAQYTEMSRKRKRDPATMLGEGTYGKVFEQEGRCRQNLDARRDHRRPRADRARTVCHSQRHPWLCSLLFEPL